MPCSVPKAERTEYVQNLVLDFFQAMEGPDVLLTLDTWLGKWGLGHTKVTRKSYRDGIRAKLQEKGCDFRTLKPTDFADDKLKSIGDVAAAVEKDLI